MVKSFTNKPKDDYDGYDDLVTASPEWENFSVMTLGNCPTVHLPLTTNMPTAIN